MIRCKDLTDVATVTRRRSVSNASKSLLQAELLSYKANLFSDNSIQKVNPNTLLIFSDFHVAQICSNCDTIFKMEDLKTHVEIWRTEDAINVLEIMDEVFHDIDLPVTRKAKSLLDSMLEDYLDGEWANIRDDSEMEALVELGFSNESNYEESTLISEGSSSLSLSQGLQSIDMGVFQRKHRQ